LVFAFLKAAFYVVPCVGDRGWKGWERVYRSTVSSGATGPAPNVDELAAEDLFIDLVADLSRQSKERIIELVSLGTRVY
jgi:hypothetical protein